MECANVWTGSQRKVSTNRKVSQANADTSNIVPTQNDNSFLRKFSFANYTAAELPEDHGTGIQLPSTFRPDYHDRTSVLKLRFNYVGHTGMHFSALGIDSRSLGHVSAKDEESSIQAIQLALKLGINYINTSPFYGEGRAEIVLGKALSTVPRKAFYIGTQVGRYKPEVEEMFDFSAERVTRSVDESLSRLGLQYVDIIQIQDVEFAPNMEIILNETLPALEKVVATGKARFISISGYSVNMLQEIIMKSRVPIDTVVSYSRYGLFNRDLKDILPDLKEEGVGVLNLAPMGMGLLSAKGPPPNHPAPESLKRAAREAVSFAKDRGEDLGQIALKYCYRVPDIATTLIDMDRPEVVQSLYSICISPMTENENSVMHDVVKGFFLPLGRTHWENIEVTKYWEQMENAGLVKPRPLNVLGEFSDDMNNQRPEFSFSDYS